MAYWVPTPSVDFQAELRYSQLTETGEARVRLQSIHE